MKSIKLYLSIMMMVLAGLVSCSDDFDMPPLHTPEATIEANTTIAELKAKYLKSESEYVTTIEVPEGESMIIGGRVVSSDEAGNIYKQLVIQDATSAITISIDANSLFNTYRVGQEVRIDVNGLHIGKYRGLIQLGALKEGSKGPERMALEVFEAHSQLNGIPNTDEIKPELVELGNLPTIPEEVAKMQSKLVQLDMVQFAEAGQPYSDKDKSTSRTIKDSKGNSIILRNSNYASFQPELMPEGEGTIIGILSYYGSDWQLLIRDTNDVINFKEIEGTSKNPYSVERAIELQGQNVSGWVKGYIVGAVLPGVTGEITSNDQIEWKAGTTMDNTLVIAPKADVKDVTKCLVIDLPADSDLRKYGNLKDNSNVYGKEIRVNGDLKKHTTYKTSSLYTSGNKKDFSIEGVEIGGNEPQPGEGNGSKESPYSATQVLGLGNPGTTAWVEGYIVGWVDNTVATYVSAESVRFTMPCASATHFLIADNPGETNIDKLVSVSFPSGSPARAALNLKDNPGNFGKKVKLKGSLIKYFGVPGVKEISEWELDGTGGGTTPEPQPGEGNGEKGSPYNVTQLLGLGNPGTTSWVEGYIVGWVDNTVATFVSAESVRFTMPCSSPTHFLIADSPSETDINKLASVNFASGSPARAALNLKDNPGNFGKKVKLKGSLIKYFGVPGVKEVSEWELDGTGGGTTPDPQPSDAIFSSTFLGDAGGFQIKDVNLPSDLQYVWQNNATYGWKASAYIDQCFEAESWIISPAISIPAGKNAVMTFDHAMNKGSKALLAVKISTDNTNWTDLTIPNWPAGTDWLYISSGDVNLSAYAGKTIYVAFKYESTSTDAPTWEIKNFVIK